MGFAAPYPFLLDKSCGLDVGHHFDAGSDGIVGVAAGGRTFERFFLCSAEVIDGFHLDGVRLVVGEVVHYRELDD